MTFSAGFNEFTPEVIWQLLLPVLVAGAICLAINYLIWPDDSINNFLGISRKTLAGYNSFFKEHTDAFLQDSPVNHNVTLPTLSAHLKNGILLMIECKRAVKREILFSRISDVDCSEISNLITNMRSPLHGIGVSLMLKNNYVYSENKNMFFNKFIDPVTMDAFTTSLKGIRPISKELSDLCYNATNQASIRLANLHYPPRTTLNSILWPFPRLWVSKKATTTTNKNCIGQTEDPVSTSILYETIHQLDEISKSNKVFCKFLGLNATQLPRNGPLYLLFLYIFSLRQHALSVASLLKLIEKLEARRVKPRILLPHQTLKKWIMSNSEVGGSVGGDENDYENQPGGNDLARVGTLQSNSHDSESNDVFEAKSSRIRKKQTKFADPDVSAPITPMQKFFYLIYLFLRWLTNTSTLFAIKTAIGVVMMAIPAWMPQNHEWYISWRGQWGMITLVLWMFPMTGAFVFGILYRIIGSVIGAVLGIIVWEMCRGNAYGMAVVCFILFLPLYYIFFFIPKYRVIALMTKVTMILVVSYEYSYVLEGLPGYDKVYTVAGKRLLLVIIGIAAGGILISLPYPPTGRVELRKKIANTMRDIGKCYGILYASTISPAGVEASPTVSKDFRKLTLQLRRQVAEERALLQHTAYEPPLRGYFHSESYKILVEKMDHLSDLVTNMGFALREVRSEWRKNIASILLQERKDYLSAILTSAKLISSTLAAKTALPPYMISPIDARQRFTSLLEKKIMIDPKDIANPSFSSYSAYLMNGLVFVDELEKVLNVTKDLVGIEDPDEWILSRS
ncbi:uncharacterized protein BX663DRAFT_14209 [Cokeromyces recurvatus]|uniref:uncharacterized protein n=1 Tax=Cokeromyces recurvatus TaxID=90255 RepID=UPI002220C380|nr:uncharacterized protein BX663DRAFT_14209 [Cokeromyces recurvatus]KAI7907901.1 hypothetical protein BX663DRAFT_14209 [Cokeromyces recurvatus]